MLLEQLIEKKDLRTYIRFRKEFLNQKFVKIKAMPKKDRMEIAYHLEGRIEELSHLDRDINVLKEQSKKYYAETR